MPYYINTDWKSLAWAKGWREAYDTGDATLVVYHSDVGIDVCFVGSDAWRQATAYPLPAYEPNDDTAEVWIAVTGNLSDGFSLYHGFSDGTHAEQWAQEMGDGAHTMTAYHYTV